MYQLMRVPLLGALALSLPLVFLGCGGGGGGGSTSSSSSSSSGGSSSGSSGGMVDTQGPTISNPRLSTGALDFRGGAVTVAAEVTDPSGIQSVVASFQKSDGGVSEVTLTAKDGSYQALYNVPANRRADGVSDTYTVTMRATDARGNTSATVSVGSITVAPPDDEDNQVPPPPVFPGLPAAPPQP